MSLESPEKRREETLFDNYDKRAFWLDDWLVEPQYDQIRRDGQCLKLESRVMAVLQYLAAHPGQVISRDTLEREIWQGTVVGYDALTGCVAKLRKSLGDRAQHSRYISTVPKKGYCLVAPVHQAGAGETQGAVVSDYADTGGSLPAINLGMRRKLWLFSGLGLSMVFLLLLSVMVPREKSPVLEEQGSPVAVAIDALYEENTPSIVVLPFEASSDSAGPASALAEDINNALSSLSGLMVIARSSAQNFGNRVNTGQDLKHLSQALGAKYVLQGSLRQMSQRLHISVVLLDAGKGVQLWGHSFNSTVSELMAVQQQVAGHIAAKLSITLQEQEKTRLAQRYTVSPAAYDAFLQGQSHYAHHSAEANLLAREFMQQAIEQDAGFARAYAAKALTYIDAFRYQWYEDSAQGLEQALMLAEKALQMDANLAQAHWVLANVYLFRRQLEPAIASALRALELRPNYADALATLAVSKLYSNDAGGAVALIRKAMRLNPLQPARYRSALGQAYYFLGLHEAASIELQAAIDSNANLTPARIYHIAALSKLGLYDEAGWQVQQLQLLTPEFTLSTVDRMFPLQTVEMAEDLYRQLRFAGFS